MRVFVRFLWTWLTIFFIGSQSAQASVVMQGTRTIVVAGMKEKSIHFSNVSNTPYLVQAWVSRTPGSKEEEKTPFILTPPIFKMDARTGQTVRLRILPASPPQIAEEVYYLNFSQLPALKTQDTESNQLLLLMRTITKIFYRPASLKDGLPDIAAKLQFRMRDNTLELENPTALHVNINSLRVESSGGSQRVVREPQMIAPRASARWPLESGIPSGQRATVHISSVNDYGAEVLTTVPIANDE